MKCTVINEGFQCGNCGCEVPAHPHSCRNHCTQCLYSQHLDKTVPGDRAAGCGGWMRPLSFDHSGKKGWMIVHECLKCQQKSKNFLSEDDSQEAFQKLNGQ